MNKLTCRLYATVLCAVICSATSVFAGSDIFLQIPEIAGDSREHPGAITVASFDQDVSNARTGKTGKTSGKRTGSGGGTGKVSLQDFHFVMKSGKATPQLMEACAKGKHFANVVLTARKSGQSQDYIVIKLEDCLISSYQTAGANTDEDLPLDQVSINFTKITYSITTPSDSGGTETTEWSFGATSPL